MLKLTEIRNQFSSRQRGLLATIWDHYVAKKQWMPVRVLHKAEGGKPSVRPLLDQIGGSAVFENEVNGVRCYQLTFLGILFSSQGEMIEELLARYLRLGRSLALEQPNRTHFASKEAQSLLGLDDDTLLMLGRAVFLSPFCSGGTFGDNEWNAGLPIDIEDYPEDPAAFIHETASKDHDPNVPLTSYDRTAYYSTAKGKTREEIFAFVIDPFLRKTATQDWADAKSCFAAKAWKPCVIACGSVSEALLLDALMRDSNKALEVKVYRHPERKPPKDIGCWSLVHLVDASAELGLIGQASSHLGHALRLHRNLVHPGRQLKDRIEVTEGDAQISINTVEKCISDLALSLRSPGT